MSDYRSGYVDSVFYRVGKNDKLYILGDISMHISSEEENGHGRSLDSWNFRQIRKRRKKRARRRRMNSNTDIARQLAEKYGIVDEEES